MPTQDWRHEAKTCLHCHREFTALYDSYADVCPECLMEYRGILVQTEGGWIWQE